ncbi:GNAT family N-acetyltransferase [Rhizobium sp. RU36D]|uniref:GNAT family N-acetyltransferase n=1 Tax=Rhizobium sp. RU36D TaxID=1907415 RepID=UPI0009D89816|nr:GNAT family N-acetyltransferase [Rhizobium sp. RU36D]SMC82848.1 Acetyltransferase (GNAT) family protein [Rhizobium sp. RU36D]
MDTLNPPLKSGYSPVPPGKIANVETRLEMLARPAAKPLPPVDPSLSLERWTSPSLADYRSLFRAVGQDWMWMSRLVMADEKLSAILADPKVEIYRLMDGERAIGLLELSFRDEGECELSFFGLVADAIGKGAGRFMMDRAIDIAWSRPIRRFWVHTCTHDSQAALPFYCRSGFTPYATLVEVVDDPRLAGLMPKEAARHVPLIEP